MRFTHVPHAFVLLLVLASLQIGPLQGQAPDPVEVTETEVVDDEWTGIWELLMQADSGEVVFTVELVTALDGAVYGTIRSDDVDYRAPIGLDGASGDSVTFGTYTHDLRLRRDGPRLTGIFEFFDERHPATLTRLGPDVRRSLMDTRDLIPMKLDLEAAHVAWPAPIAPDSTYLVADGRIRLAVEDEGRWITTALRYDTTRWQFASIGLSPERDRLIAHGRPLDVALPHFGNGDLYMLHLTSPTEIGRIEHLPASVNTPSFDNFASFTPTGGILVTSWGEVPGLEPRGRADLYLAEPAGEGDYRVSLLDGELNTPQVEAGAAMDPWGRFLLFHRKDRERGLPDRLFISERTADGWSEPEQLGPPVNREFTWSYAGRIDPGGTMLFFNTGFRGQTEIFRVPLHEIPRLARYH